MIRSSIQSGENWREPPLGVGVAVGATRVGVTVTGANTVGTAVGGLVGVSAGSMGVLVGATVAVG